MTPSYYGNLYRRYQTYVRNYDPKQPIFKVCCGPNAGDTYWTEEVLKTCFENAPEWLHGFMDGLSLHYYTLPGVTGRIREVRWISMMRHGTRP